jgi:hypothetical protein
VCRTPYWGIPTADTTTPLSDDNAPDPTRTRRKVKSTPAPQTEEAKPAAAARRPAKKAASPTRSPKPDTPGSPAERPAPAARRPARKTTSAAPASKAAAGAPASKAAAGLPPKPVWAPEPVVTPKVAVLPEPVDEAVPPPIPNWEGAPASASWPDALYDDASSTSRPPRLVHSVEEAHRHHNRRSRAFLTTAVLASLFVVFVVVMVVMVLLHHSDNPPAGTASTVTVVAPETARLQTATKTMDTNASTTRSALHSLNGIPTTVSVAAVINPYVTDLQRYEAILSGAKMPTAALGAAAKVRAQLSLDVRSLATIDGLPPLRLGTYLEEFGTGVNELQKSLGTLEHALGAPTS